MLRISLILILIHIRGSFPWNNGFGSGSWSDLNWKNYIFFSNFFSIKKYNIQNYDFMFVIYELIIHVNWTKKLYSCNFGRFVCTFFANRNCFMKRIRITLKKVSVLYNNTIYFSFFPRISLSIYAYFCSFLLPGILKFMYIFVVYFT